MRIITSGSLKDYYDRYSNPTDRDLVWVRVLKPVYQNEPEVQRINGYVGGFNYSFKPHSKELFLGNGDVHRIPYKAQPMDYEPLHRISIYESHWGRKKEDTVRRYSKAVIIFCGKVYRGITYSEAELSDGKIGMVTELGSRHRTYWDLKTFCEHHYVDIKGLDTASEAERAMETTERMDAWFNPGQGAVRDVCVELNTPILVSCYQDNHAVWMKNGLVKDLQFIKVMDPPTAFQELEMYVGGVMVKHETIAPVPDKLKVQAHGMDERSFRKDPTKVHR